MSKITCEIKEIHWVTSWKYTCRNSECPICRTELETATKDNIVIGECGHGFHAKCLSDWHKQTHKKTCPVCNKKWVPAKDNGLKAIEEFKQYIKNSNKNNNFIEWT